MRRLHPEPAQTTVAEQFRSLDLVSMAHSERPYLVTNFALTLDGQATIDGRSGAIGGEADTAMLVGLRTRIDAVMIGAQTMRAERYGRVIADPQKRARREREGLSHDPLMVIVSASLDLPWDAPLFTEGHGQILIATSSTDDIPATVTSLSVLRQSDGVDLSGLMAHLRTQLDIRALLCEGGPRLHTQLVEQGLVDELFVTHVPKLAGGGGPGLFTGLAAQERELELTWLLQEEKSGELFGRYRF